MATRFYPDVVAVPTISPAFLAAWDQTTAMVRKCMFVGQAATGQASADVAEAETDVTNPFAVGLVQLVSEPIAAQTITGTIDIQALCLESNAAANFAGHYSARVFNGAGTAVRGTLKTASGATEFDAGAATNRTIADGVAVTSVIAQDGDVIVLELGYNSTNATTDSHTGTITLNGGEIGGTDLPADEAETDNDNCWMELSHDVAFLNKPVTGVTLKKGLAVNKVVKVAGTANTNTTLTLPGVPGAYHAITSIEAYRAAAATTAAGVVHTITTLNLPGHPSWVIGRVTTDGLTEKDISMRFKPPLLSLKAGAPTVFAFPAGGTDVSWSARVTYYITPGN